MSQVPIIDLSLEDEALVTLIHEACSTLGFFQVIHHGVDEHLIESFRQASAAYFALSDDQKERYRRDVSNARGFFDNELTKQRRDWKQCLDVGVPGSRDWTIPDLDSRNTCLDGFNRLPSEEELPGFRSCILKYFEACQALSARLARLMALGLGVSLEEDELLPSLRDNDSSYLRLNYYPPFPIEAIGEHEQELPLGIGPHQDAGFLTVLLQDNDCHSLQVASMNHTDSSEGLRTNEWMTVHPVPDSLTINTGDMCQIWSNGRYRANLHRVVTDPTRMRYSAPFFYNPGYDVWVKPQCEPSVTPRYEPCLWGYFRALRFTGDVTDFGTEIQVTDYERRSDDIKSWHVVNQLRLSERMAFDKPWNVEVVRSWTAQYLMTVPLAPERIRYGSGASGSHNGKMSIPFVPDDFFVVKASGLSQAQALTAYLGGSAFQTIMDNPVTAYRQLVQQYAKDAEGKAVDPKIASQEAKAVFRAHPVSASLSGVGPRLVGVGFKRIPKFGVLLGFSFFLGEGENPGFAAATAASILSAPFINPIRMIEKQQRAYFKQTGATKPISEILKESAAQRFAPLFRGTVPLMGHSLASALLGLVGQPRLQKYIQKELGDHTSLGRSATGLIASSVVSPIYVVVTNPLSRLEVIMQTSRISGKSITVFEACKEMAVDMHQFGLRGIFRGQGIGIMKAVISLTLFHEGRHFLQDAFKQHNIDQGYYTPPPK